MSPVHPADEPIPLRAAVEELTRDLGLPEPGALGALPATWADVAGPALAAHTTVGSLRDGVLTVEVDAPAWATQLRYLESDLVSRLTARLGAGLVRALRVVVASVPGDR